VTVPAGRFPTIVVRPTIKTSGLFGEGGEAELHFSDDAYHTLVQLRSKVRRIGSLSLHLRRYDPPPGALSLWPSGARDHRTGGRSRRSLSARAPGTAPRSFQSRSRPAPSTPPRASSSGPCVESALDSGRRLA